MQGKRLCCELREKYPMQDEQLCCELRGKIPERKANSYAVNCEEKYPMQDEQPCCELRGRVSNKNKVINYKSRQIFTLPENKINMSIMDKNK